MDRISKLSETLTGKPLSVDQRALYERLANACGLKDDDPLWTVMVIFGHYERLYVEIPGRIEAAANAKAREVRDSLDAHLTRERTAIASNLAAGVEHIVRDTLRTQTAIRLTRWVVAATTIASTAVVIAFAVGVISGRSTSYAEDARRYVWTIADATPVARRLGESGVLGLIGDCQRHRGEFTMDTEGATCIHRNSSGATIRLRIKIPKN